MNVVIAEDFVLFLPKRDRDRAFPDVEQIDVLAGLYPFAFDDRLGDLLGLDEIPPVEEPDFFFSFGSVI